MDPLIIIVVISVIGPVLGSAIGVMKKPSLPFICTMLSFAAGVMLAISFLELIPESIHLSSVVICVVGVIAGSLLMFGLDRMIPHIHPELCTQEQGRNLQRTSIYLILGIFLHNFPEGMAIAVGAVSDIKISIAVAFAISIHNIPEGICTSAPFYHVTGNRMKSFIASSSTAIPIVVGYLLARHLFLNIPEEIIGFIIGATAGLMIYITADELIPTSCSVDNHKTIFSLITGVVFVLFLGMV